jgi:hypothetical protein
MFFPPDELTAPFSRVGRRTRKIDGPAFGRERIRSLHVARDTDGDTVKGTGKLQPAQIRLCVHRRHGRESGHRSLPLRQ